MASQCIACGAAVPGQLQTRKRQQHSKLTSAVSRGLTSCPAPALAPVWQRRCKRKAVLQAKKQGQANDAEDAGEWAALAKDDEEPVDETLQQKLNQICNEGVKLMLKNSSTRELEEYKDKVSNLGASFSEEKDMQGATFAYALYKMTEHVQVEEIENLQGMYQAACVKMFGLLEDSGWALKKENEEETDSPQDEDPLPDVPTLGSYSGVI